MEWDNSTDSWLLFLVFSEGDMTYWNWTPDLEIGIDVIDGQHRRIVDYLNDVHSAVAARDRKQITDTLDNLVDYTVTHFAFEEALMEQAGYKQVDDHKRVHARFTQRIQDYQRRNEEGEDVARQLLQDLKIWLTNHIKRDDQDYAPTVRDFAKGSWVSRALGRFFKGSSRS